MELPKDLGGLGIGNIFHRNLALLFKWVWRFFNEPNSLWRHIIKEKYNYASSLNINDLSIPHKGGPWKSLISAVMRYPMAKLIANQGIRKTIGNGTSSVFWHDIWLGQAPLKSQFPRLFRIALDNMAAVSSYALWDGLDWAWSFSWARPLRPRDE